MTTYLFITKPDYTPERSEQSDLFWSCSKNAAVGDLAWVYVTGRGICLEWLVTSQAEPDDDWGYMCDVSHLRTFDVPISIAELREAIPRVEWAPPHQNFRGNRSLLIPDEVANKIRDLRSTEFTLPSAIPPIPRLPEEVDVPILFSEGAVRRITVNAYERNIAARRKCIEYHGVNCVVCGFSFGRVYGAEFSEFIHVHHLLRLSDSSGPREVNYIDDLRPVCPNCHAVLHLRNPPYSIDEVKAFLTSTGNSIVNSELPAAEVEDRQGERRS
ncbi:MAG: HNH endonuclease [Planctomycetales bacterium]|nr:HNH endonuclease [Planctomycetales bacterium]